MTTAQKVIKYVAIGFAIFLIVNIISGILLGVYIVGNILGLTDSNNISEDMKVISTNVMQIDEMNIELAYTNLQIKTGDFFKVETDNSKISFLENNGKIVIKEENNWLWRNNNAGHLIIYIPENLTILNDVKIEAGAGEITINTLEAKELHLNLGAGKVYIENLIVEKEADIDGGAGKLEIISGEINNLDLDMGVGEIILQSNLIGKSDIDAGIGNLNIELLGNKESYKIEANKGFGNIEIDNKDIVGEEQVWGTGENYIKIDGGIGNILVDFNDENYQKYSKIVDNVNIELNIPNEWKYKEMPRKEENDFYKFALKLYKNSEEQYALVYFYNNPFGVCGTGRTSEKIILDNGKEATIGYYDRNTNWSDISAYNMNKYIAVINYGLINDDAKEVIEFIKTINIIEDYNEIEVYD